MSLDCCVYIFCILLCTARFRQRIFFFLNYFWLLDDSLVLSSGTKKGQSLPVRTRGPSPNPVDDIVAQDNGPKNVLGALSRSAQHDPFVHGYPLEQMARLLHVLADQPDIVRVEPFTLAT